MWQISAIEFKESRSYQSSEGSMFEEKRQQTNWRYWPIGGSNNINVIFFKLTKRKDALGLAFKLCSTSQMYWLYRNLLRNSNSRLAAYIF